MDKTFVRLQITRDEKRRLREIARAFDLTIGRGREMDWGSINQLNREIAAGNLLVVRNPNVTSNGSSNPD